MTAFKYVRIDGIKWWITENGNIKRYPQAICPQHDLRLYPISTMQNSFGELSRTLTCEEGPHQFNLSRTFANERRYVIDKVDAKVFSTQTFVTIDDEVIPVAREKLKESPYWVDAKVTKSKTGTRLVIWAGDREKKNKTQLFVETDLKKLSFDHNDTHPNEVFAIVEAKFADGSSATIESDT